MDGRLRAQDPPTSSVPRSHTEEELVKMRAGKLCSIDWMVIYCV